MTYQTILAALSDPTRRQIFESLGDNAGTVGELATGRSVSRPAVSQHLKVLHEAGLVDVQARGTRRIYSLRQAGLQELRQYLDRFCLDDPTASSHEVQRRAAEVQAEGVERGH